MITSQKASRQSALPVSFHAALFAIVSNVQGVIAWIKRSMVLSVAAVFALTASLLIVSLASSSQDASATAAEQWLASERTAHRSALKELVSIPSVSADRSRAGAVREAAEWLVKYLSESGLEHARLLETTRHPSVYADHLHAGADAPTILVYAHFDVQPEDPLALWTSPPFKAEVRDGILYGRGVSDDKGNLLASIIAAKAYIKTSRKLPVNIKFLFEGEEEIGSPNLRQLLLAHRDLLRIDYSFSADGSQISHKQPGICVSLRGSVAAQIDVVGAEKDAHSGMFGGGVQNPLHALSQMLARLHHPENGSVRVPGFYDGVDDLTEEERLDISKYPMPAKVMLANIGAKAEFGEHGFSFFERYG